MFPTRRLPTAVGVFGLVVAAVTTAAPAASSTAKPPTVKPVIGQPVTVPAQPRAGSRFAVSFKVTRSDTGMPLTRGTMFCDPSIAGTVIPHQESFRAGTARLSFLVPATATGVLKVKVTIIAAGQSATRVAAFRIAVQPKLTIGDTSGTEGNASTTTLSFPVTLSAASAQTVSVQYATVNGTATVGSDYLATSGTLTFAPGETAKTIPVRVVGDTTVEQDERFTVSLLSPLNASILRGSGTGTIRNDDVAPPATAGHYTGATSQSYQLTFDVAAGGFQLTNLDISRIDLSAGSCSLAGLGPYSGIWWHFWNISTSISSSGAFSIDRTYNNSDPELGPYTVKLGITGQFAGTTASGTLNLGMNFTFQGVAQNCATNLTWTARM